MQGPTSEVLPFPRRWKLLPHTHCALSAPSSGSGLLHALMQVAWTPTLQHRPARLACAAAGWLLPRRWQPSL
jgi:hypothetical protein